MMANLKKEMLEMLEKAGLFEQETNRFNKSLENHAKSSEGRWNALRDWFESNVILGIGNSFLTVSRMPIVFANALQIATKKAGRLMAKHSERLFWGTTIISQALIWL